MATVDGDLVSFTADVQHSKFRPRPSGNVDLSAFETVTGGGVSDSQKPLVTLISPADLSVPLGALTPIVIDVKDNLGQIAQVIVVLEFANSAVSEVVFDGTNFTASYINGSSRSNVTNGFRFSILRTGGWPGSPITLRVFAADASGNALTG